MPAPSEATSPCNRPCTLDAHTRSGFCKCPQLVSSHLPSSWVLSSISPRPFIATFSGAARASFACRPDHVTCQIVVHPLPLLLFLLLPPPLFAGLQPGAADFCLTNYLVLVRNPVRMAQKSGFRCCKVPLLPVTQTRLRLGVSQIFAA